MFLNNADISDFSGYKTRATAKYFFELQSEADIEKLGEIDSFCREQKLPILFIGGGTNMLFAFDQYPGVVIKNKLCGWEYNKETHILETYSEEKIRHIASILEKEDGQSLWHRFIGLPGSIGGAIYGNAGCFGLETEGNFVSAKVFDRQSGQIQIFSKEDMEFSYRNSKLKREAGRYYIISARFDLSENKEKYAVTEDNIYFREHKQPKGNSCGSFFKNPDVERQVFVEKFPELRDIAPKRISAGFLIEQVGLRGYHLGGAYFSELHANFLMHDGTGNYQDLMALVSLAQKKVQKKFGIHLENEVQIITIN